ncbi:unnamed protein product [Auanema sp. JU1783]|nr:unnamed protein product [Auanema sp. JU1783]
MSGFGFAIDRGGTFTDVCVFKPDGTTRVLKVLSEDPANYSDAPTEAIRKVLEEETGQAIPRGTAIPTENIKWVRMGTTVATNALLERKGERIALVITKGFRHLLSIGNQSRPKIFEFDIQIPDILYEDVVEINERVIPYQGDCQLNLESTIEEATNGSKVVVLEEINKEEVRQGLQTILDKGIRSIAVVLLHSFLYPKHEKLIKDIANELGFSNISLSHDIMPMIKVVPRGFTVTADAYLTPKIKEYIRSFEGGFDGGISRIRVDFMQSDGGLCDVNRFFGSKAILSGPAGGVVGISRTSYDGKTPVIGFDMGGTSTDVCRFSGELEHVMETTTAGITIQAPQLDISTVAAGGGSRLFFRNGLFVVGPESAGAHPGPVCYKKNGYLTVTDANLVLGRIIPEYFPKIFGPNADESLDVESTQRAFRKLTDEINEYLEKNTESHLKYSIEEVAHGFLLVANEEMCRPIRSITQARGYDTSAHVLCSFGGAGGQHACAIAQNLGINEVRIHKYSSILSAYGIALADVVIDVQQPLQFTFEEENFNTIMMLFAELSGKVKQDLYEQKFTSKSVRCEFFLHMRFERTDCAIMVKSSLETGNLEELHSFTRLFRENYKREFGFILENRKIIIDDIRVRGIGMSGVTSHEVLGDAHTKTPDPVTSRQVYFQTGLVETKVYNLSQLLAGHEILGPALIIDVNSTIVVEPDCKALITKEGNITLQVVRHKEVAEIGGTIADPIRLAIFSNRFMSIAEQMGRVLQRTSISTNIKERLDFSCALFGPEGGLIANAPHIPVHLGGMQYSVRFQIDNLGLSNINDGDVILSNHPIAGGSHLPDLTVITPVFFTGIKEPVFFLANRGHHADIGGLVPGSMPPNATHINQEGASFVSFKVVEKGEFQEDKLTEMLMAPGQFEGCSGTRNLPDNISDLKAQIAANNKGIKLVCDLISEYGLDVVQAYMSHIQSTAEISVRDMLKKFGKAVANDSNVATLHSIDYMDDGTPIELTITIDTNLGEAVFDFTGTGHEVMSSCNAPKAVTMSAIIYCLRCLVGKDIPLNNGCLAPIKIHIPDGCLLSPSSSAPVVAGNVLTSQRLCDVILKSFGVVAASQGCMNNVTFGDEKMGYYETIAGGAGAGDGFNGRSAVHTHMTNTRITDPEILESRYPTVLKEFSLREGSGGAGKYRGGNGVIRKIQFRRPMSMSILTERRSFAPYGLFGGECGQRGLNLLIRDDRNPVNIGSKITMNVQPRDILEIHTPGGGGYGTVEGNE